MEYVSRIRKVIHQNILRILYTYFNQQNVPNKIQENTYHKMYFTLGANSYMCRYHGAILKELNNDKES
jgi:hypothetical protein